MHLINKNEIMLSIKENLEELKNDPADRQVIQKIIKTIDTSINEDDNWDQFTQYFDQVHSDFFRRLKTNYPDITPQETRLAAYLRMNLTTKNIAQLSNISVRGVEISRYRLRKRLNLSRTDNLTSVIMDL